MCVLSVYIKLSIFRNIFLKIEKIVNTFLISEKIFLKIHVNNVIFFFFSRKKQYQYFLYIKSFKEKNPIDTIMMDTIFIVTHVKVIIHCSQLVCYNKKLWQYRKDLDGGIRCKCNYPFPNHKIFFYFLALSSLFFYSIQQWIEIKNYFFFFFLTFNFIHGELLGIALISIRI